MTFECVEVAQGGWPQDRRPELQVGGRQDGVVDIVGLGTAAGIATPDEAIDQVRESRHPQAGGEMIVKGRDRLPMERGVVGEPWICHERASAGDLEVEPLRGLGASFSVGSSTGVERRGQSPRGSRRAIPLANVGDLHRRRV
jgi:hypothetical protein